VLEKLLKLDPKNPNVWIQNAKFQWKFLGDAKAAEKMFIRAAELDSTPASLTQRIAFVREVRDDLVEAEKLQQTVVFNLEHRKQERWEFFIRNDNEAFTQQKQSLVKKLILSTTKSVQKLLPGSEKSSKTRK